MNYLTIIAMKNLLVVRSGSSYNAIIGQPKLNKIWEVTSAYHLKMKFPIDTGVGEV